MTWAGDRMVSVAYSLIRKGWWWYDPSRRHMGRYPCSVHMVEGASEWVTATPSGTGEIVRMSTKIERSFVMQTLAPESAIDDVAGWIDEGVVEGGVDSITVTGISGIGELKTASSSCG